MGNLPLNNDQLKILTPSIFSTQAYHTVSNRYTYISTEKILDIMRTHGWMPVDAFENRVRIENKQNFQHFKELQIC